jgi:hypothetical protein
VSAVIFDQPRLAQPATVIEGKRTMNWRRGLLRLWFVLSLCWIAGVGLSSSREFVFEDSPDTARDQQSESLEKIINSLNAETAKQYAQEWRAGGQALTARALIPRSSITPNSKIACLQIANRMR